MKNYMNKLWLGMSLASMLLAFSSCLTGGLEELESYSDAEIKGFRFEYRWERPIGEDNASHTQLGVITLNTTVEIENEVVACTIEVPEAGNPSMFTEEIRQQVNLNRLVGMATISTAATIEPVGKAPVLGKWGDFSGDCKYLVTAADGKTTREWTVRCTFVK